MKKNSPVAAHARNGRSITSPTVRWSGRITPATSERLPFDGPCEAGRSASALEADFAPNVGLHRGARLLESRARPRVAVDHDAIARTDRQYVRSHRIELLIWHFDERHTSTNEQLAERHRHQRRIDHSEIPIDRTDDRHEVKYVAGAAPVRQRNRDEPVDAVAKERSELPNPVVVRAVPAAHRNRAFVEPHDVAALDRTGWIDAADHGNAPGEVRAFLRVGLGDPLRLPHVTQHDAARRGDGGVAHV